LISSTPREKSPTKKFAGGWVMATKIDLDFLKTSLPLLETELKEKYSRLTSIFKELISAKTENEAFFKSPLKYLESMQAVPSLEIAKGQKLPLLRDEALVQTIRKARDLYKAGKLELINITTDTEFTSEKRNKFMDERITPNRIMSESEHKSTFQSFKIANVLEIDGRLIGPLADPMVFEKLHASIESELKKAKGSKV
jgi:hypothetical protein